jgi:UDP:flavonoid glycosyltransferase YjiC (YdhE family)
MARIVLTCFGSYGDVHPFLGLALELRRRRHDPVLALPPSYRRMVESEGLPFRPVRPDVDLQDRDLAGRIMDSTRGTDAVFSDTLIPSLDDTFADLMEATEGADLLVTHPTSLTGPTVAEERGLPWASTVLAPLSFFSVHDPVVPAPAPWIHALTSRSRMLSRLFLRQTRRITQKWAEPVRRFRTERGLAPGPNPILEGQHSPWRVLALFSRTMAAPQPDWPDHTRVTGAILWDGPGEASIPPRLVDFLDAGDAPLVFTLGSSAVGAAGSFYEVAARVSRRLGRRAVLLTGTHPGNRPSLDGADLLVIDAARYSALFPRAEAVIHHGGAGTLHQALRAGRPMLVVPFAHDQPDNASRAERIGVARIIPPRRFDDKRLAHELRELLANASYRERARATARVVAEEGGATAAATALEELL